MCIFDLDDTLIRGDSFRRLLMSRVWRSPQLAILMIARKLNLVDRTKFAGSAHRIVAASFDLDRIVLDAMNRLNVDVLDTVKAHKEKGDLVVLISASPDEYVSRIGDALGFDHAKGSHWVAADYTHLHGHQKIRYLEQNFSQDDFDWVYAVSDSITDIPLLQKCKNSLLYKSKT